MNSEIKIIESIICENLGGGFELSTKVVERENNIFIFTVHTEFNNIYIFDKDKYYNTLKLVQKELFEEGIEIDINNITSLDVLCSDNSILDPNIKDILNLPSIDDKYLYDNEYIEKFLNDEIKKYFNID